MFGSITITIITTTRHQSGLDRPVSTPSNCLFKALPNRLVPSGLQFSTIFAILLLFILVACRCQFDFYLLSFLSTGSAFSYPKISAFLLWSKIVCPAVLLSNSILIDVNPFFFHPFLSAFPLILAHVRTSVLYPAALPFPYRCCSAVVHPLYHAFWCIVLLQVLDTLILWYYYWFHHHHHHNQLVMRKKRNDKRFNGEMIIYLMAALGGIKRHRYVEMSPVAKLGHPYGLLFRAYQSHHLIKLEYPSIKFQVYLQNSTRKHLNRNVHKCPHNPYTAVKFYYLGFWASSRLVNTFNKPMASHLLFNIRPHTHTHTICDFNQFYELLNEF